MQFHLFLDRGFILFQYAFLDQLLGLGSGLDFMLEAVGPHVSV